MSNITEDEQKLVEKWKSTGMMESFSPSDQVILAKNLEHTYFLLTEDETGKAMARNITFETMIFVVVQRATAQNRFVSVEDVFYGFYDFLRNPGFDVHDLTIMGIDVECTLVHAFIQSMEIKKIEKSLVEIWEESGLLEDLSGEIKFIVAENLEKTANFACCFEFDYFSMKDFNINFLFPAMVEMTKLDPSLAVNPVCDGLVKFFFDSEKQGIEIDAHEEELIDIFCKNYTKEKYPPRQGGHEWMIEKLLSDAKEYANNK